ncbi:MAG TPA: choice-of-anchor D domain-containing protein [Acidimicrobiales bacterium]|nr:choice-of-anchor D domain-containing protein [Acidimicrobiales bacterium]
MTRAGRLAIAAGTVLASAVGVGLTAGAAGATTPVLTATPTQVDFGDTPVGQFGFGSVRLQNDGSSNDHVSGATLSGPDVADFTLFALCGTTTTVITVARTGFTVPAGQTCLIGIFFSPAAAGPRQATATFDDQSADPPSVSLTGNGTLGYYETSASGAVFDFGNATNLGDMSGYTLRAPVVGMAVTSFGGGYWLVTTDGGIFAFGTAAFHGSTGGMPLNEPVVGMAPTPDGGGYWLVASDGGMFAFGDAKFYGSTGSMHLNQPVVGMAPTPDGKGYWLVAADGGIFAFGDAQFYGSTGSLHLNQPIVGMAATPTGGGYWFTAADGGIFAFGDAPFLGSTGGTGVHDVVGMASTGSPLFQAVRDLPGVRPQARIAT